MRVVLVTAGFLAVLAPSALAQYENDQTEDRPDAEVDANGNAFVPGSLSFEPAKVRVPVGGVVRWTNTDQLVPHTSTEDHGLWRLSGDYGSPGPAQGYGPGESVERAFEAGTHRYYCEVHPEDMRAVVETPVTLKKRSGRAVVTLAPSAPADELAFDVQRRRNGGKWRTLVAGTEARRVTFRLGPPGTRWDVRARLRSAQDKAKATGWSPRATVRR